MTSLIEEKNKIIKSFFIIGLNESLIQKYEDNGETPIYIQYIDIFIKELPYDYKPANKDEKWLLIIKENNVWLRIKYSYEYYSPITDFKIVDCDYESPEYLLLEKKYINEEYIPIMVSTYKKEDNNNNNNDNNKIYPIINEYKFYEPYSDIYVKIPSYLNIKEILNLPVKSKYSVLLISRKYTLLPLKDIIIQRRQDGNYNFGIKRNKTPYSYRYIPEILDQYPQGEETNSSISMFCFPNGLVIKEQYNIPTWHTFALTNEIGERTYGSTLIFWDNIENSTKENFIPYYDEIDPKTKNRKYFFIQKAICILSRFPFYYNSLLFLKQLYKIQTTTKSQIPLERAICTFVDSLYIQSNNEIIQFIIREEKLNFYRIANYGDLWDTNNNYLEVLFRVLSFKQIVIAWQGLLLEKKLFLICSSKATLSCVAYGLVNLLFPFKWIHVFIPILPEKLKPFIDSPVPLIIGISFNVDLNDFPKDSLILNINSNKFENYYNHIPKLTGRLNSILEKKLKFLKEKYGIDDPKDSKKWMDYQDEPLPLFILGPYTKIDTTEIRDVFYNVFISMFKNYNKFMDWEEIKKYLYNSNNQNEEENITQKIFKKRIFLKEHSCNDENDFISLFSETSLFNQFIEIFLKMEPDGAMGYFLESIKNGKGDKKVYLPDIIPERIRILPEIDIKDLNGQTFTYDHFPNKLQNYLYIKSNKPKKPFKPKFVKYEDEWCYKINKLKKKEWPKYLLYLIYEIWFHFFSFVIHFYRDEESLILMDYALFLLEDLIDNKKITPTRSLFGKLLKSCGRNNLSSFVKKILLLANKIYKNSKYSNLFHNSFLSGLYALTENVGEINTNISIPSNNSYLNSTAIRSIILNDIYSDDYDTKLIIDNIIFISSKICPNCVKNKNKLYKIEPEHIFAGFNSIENKIYIICPKCLAKIEPNLYYLKKSQSNLKPQKLKLIPPYILIQNIDLLINKEKEIFFYKRVSANYLENFMDIYISLIFYFKLFDLPLFVLYTPKNNNNFINEIIQEIQSNKIRNMYKKEKKSSGKSISPDRVSRSPDRSSDNKSRASGDLTDISRKSTLSNISELESELWKNIQISCTNNEIISNEIINSNEKSEFASKLKYMKSELSKLMNYFLNLSKEEIDIFLNKFSEKKENDVKIELKKENALKRYTKTLSNNNVIFNTDRKTNINIMDINKDSDEKIKKRIINTNINLVNYISNNLQKKEDDEIKNNNFEEEKPLLEKDNNNMSFSGILEILDDKKSKNKNKKNENLLNNIEEGKISINSNNKQIINNKKIIEFFSEEKNKINNLNDIKSHITYSQKEKNNKINISNRDTNITSENENKISDFDFNDKTKENLIKKINNFSNKEQESSLINKINNNNNSENEAKGEIQKNSVPVKKRKIRIISGSNADEFL